MTWPKVFDGIGALFVRCDNDPDVQAARIPGLTWCAVKVNGDDCSPPDVRRSWSVRMAAHGVPVGWWIYNYGPPFDDVMAVTVDVTMAPFVIYDVEAEYKRDAPSGHFEWSAELVNKHKAVHGSLPAAVTSYGGYKSSLDFGAFASAGWPILAQCYDSFSPGDEQTYVDPGPYPAGGVHQLLRSLKLKPGQAVYRPESING